MTKQMPEIYLLALRPELAQAFTTAFSGLDRVEIFSGDFLSFMQAHPDIEGIVSPTNSFGMMSGGLDKVLRDYFGKSLQKAVREKIQNDFYGEQTVGTSMLVDIPDFPGKKLLHTPTMRTPSPILDDQIIYLCMRSVLMTALDAHITSLMIPAFGGETGRVPENVVSENMRTAYDQIQEQLHHPLMATFRSAKVIIREHAGREPDSGVQR